MFNFLNKKTSTGQSVTLKLSGLHCVSCALMVDSVLEELPGVLNSDTDYARSEARVQFDSQKIDIKDLIAKINEAGYQAEVLKPGSGQ